MNFNFTFMSPTKPFTDITTKALELNPKHVDKRRSKKAGKECISLSFMMEQSMFSRQHFYVWDAEMFHLPLYACIIRIWSFTVIVKMRYHDIITY